MSVRMTQNKCTRLAVWAAVLLSIPFFIGAVTLGWRFIHVPDTLGSMTKGQILQAVLFAFGFALGLVGATIALVSESHSRRLLGTATTLFGCAHIMLGFAVKQVIEQQAANSAKAVLPFIIPTVLWGYSVMLAIRAPATLDEEEQPAQEQTQVQEPTEGQQ